MLKTFQAQKRSRPDQPEPDQSGLNRMNKKRAVNPSPPTVPCKNIWDELQRLHGDYSFKHLSILPLTTQ